MRQFFLASVTVTWLLFSTFFSAPCLWAAPYAYITNFGSNDLSVIDTTTHALVTTIPVGIKPQGIVANINKTRAYIANSGSDTISVVDTVSNHLVTTIPVGDYPIGIAMQIDDSYILVANGGDDTVSLIKTSDQATIAVIDVGDSPVGVAVTPDGAKAYVVNFRSNNVSVIDLFSRSVVQTISVGYHPQVVYVDRRGEYAYVTNSDANSVSVIRIATNSVIATIPVGRAPQCLAMSMDGTKVYVTNNYDNTVSVIDAGNHTVISTFSVGQGPQGIDVDLNDVIYVANFDSNNISVINGATYTITATMPAGQSPMAFGRFIGGNPRNDCTCVLSPCPPPPPECINGGGLVLKINQIDDSQCPTIRFYFTVTDLNGNPVSGLSNSNFTLSENFIQCPAFDVVSAENTSEPAAVAVTMDYSGSMIGQPLQDSQSAAVRFVQGMDTQDIVEVIKFSDSYEVVQPFTANRNLLNTVITSRWNGAGGSTALYDAVYQAISNTSRQTSRKAVVVMTDGRNNNSTHSLAAVIAYARQEHVPVFTVGMGNAIELALKRLAHETGGVYYYSPTSGDLVAIYDQIARVIRSQYYATYTTCMTSGRSHNIALNVNYNGKTGNDIAQFIACSMVTTNACTAELTPALKIHIPVISYDTIFGITYLWSDLQYVDLNDGNIWFRVTAGGQEAAGAMPCQAATYNRSSGLLHVPDIIFRDGVNQLSLWADFEYVPTSDNLIRLKLTNYGLK